MTVGSKMTAKLKFSRNASDIRHEPDTFKAKGIILSFWVSNAVPLQPGLTLRHMKQT